MDKPSKYVRYDQLLVESARLPEETEKLLLISGLPQLDLDDEDLLGIHFKPLTEQGIMRTRDDRKTLLPIGYEYDEASVILGLETDTGTLYRVDVQTGEYSLMNSNLSLFIEFLQRCAAFINEYSESYEPSVMTLEQAQAKLAAFRRGEIMPSQQTSSQSARGQALKNLHFLFAEKDPISVLNEETWWSVVLEQLEDELL
ncbi:SUKH-4 family immunity protein [Paenibacillus pabuli]|uniref:SUKH-4 family immunity protein n=1 Tax=Paenibacillus pabuli TaxID=1472 RepID=UPI001FFE33C0|nr:SUKH-4 family immunity protein [Paenibacillus pabuli]UPK43532.1 SUKH-4 family immunity protein [Paenibacillus pabuli]